MTASPHKTELGLPDTVLYHGILAQLLEIHVTIHGFQQFVISTVAAENGLTVLVGPFVDQLLVIQIYGDPQGVGHRFRLIN